MMRKGAMKKTTKFQIPLILLIFLFFVLVWPFGISAESAEEASNKAVSVKILESTATLEVSGEKASKGRVFIVLETEWENIHPKQKVEKDKMEGKTDRTMGVGTLAGRKQKKKTEYVEADVTYMVEKLFDHAYLVADGLAYSLDEMTETVPEGIELREPFTIAKQGEKRKAVFIYSIPENAENIGFQFFDYEYGHILLPIKGNLKEAKGAGKPPGKVLDQIQTDDVEIAVHSFDFQTTHADDEASEGWEYAVVHLSGKSLSGKTVKDIVQIEPTEYTWISIEGGYIYYASGGTLTEQGMIRFTPEIFQHQQLVFLTPKSERVHQLSIRLRNDVFQLNLTDSKPKGIPKSIATHRDGDVMEVMVFDVRIENGNVILDLGIQSLATSGIEIQKDAQFMLVVNDEQISSDDSLTDDLPHRPPTPFTIPPKTFVRFELAFETSDSPTSLYYRGYSSENYFRLSEKNDS
jgi:hypothetical protein